MVRLIYEGKYDSTVTEFRLLIEKSLHEALYNFILNFYPKPDKQRIKMFYQ
jgi:hypothetical protein